MKLLGKRQKLGNQGLSLIELLCSMAILGMLGMVVSSVLVVSANSYRRENADTGAQQEAQLVANQITDLLIDASAHGAVAQVSFDPATGTLTITQGNIGYEVSYVSSEQKLYYSQYQLDASGNRLNVTPKQLMAENVKSFSVDVSSFAETGNIAVDMVYTKDTEEYPAAFTVTARNMEQTPEVVEAELKVPAEIIQEPSQNFYKIRANIIGGSGTLTYTCEGHSDLVGTRVDPDGTVVIGNKETANMFRVKVTATVNGPSGAITKEQYVRIYVRRATAVSVAGRLDSGTDCQAGAKYRLEAFVDGNNMNKAVGTDYDDPADPSDPNSYVDPYGINWSVSGVDASLYKLTPDATDNNKATLVLLGNLPNDTELTVTAKAAHPQGTNKSGAAYYPGAEAYWKLKKSGSGESVFVMGDGWLRQTDRAQATVNGEKLNEVKPPHGGRHTFQVRFRKYPDGTWEEYGPAPGGWLNNKYGGDADDSMTINMRPLLTGALDYSKDYEMQIRMTIYDNAGNKVWPTASTPESEYLISSVVYRVGVIFKGDHLGFGDTTMVNEASAPTVKMARDQGYDMMHYTGIQGIEASAISNQLAFILEKKNNAGGWDQVTQNVEIQNANGTFKLTFRNSDNYTGNYRVKVYARDMPNWQLEGLNLVNKGNINYILYDEATGHNIFYFNVTK